MRAFKPVAIGPGAGPDAKGLMQLGYGCCRFPVGEATGADQLFCAAPRPEGQAYCPTHQRIASGGRPAVRELRSA